jgi:hypothetical protein
MPMKIIVLASAKYYKSKSVRGMQSGQCNYDLPEKL